MKILKIIIILCISSFCFYDVLGNEEIKIERTNEMQNLISFTDISNKITEEPIESKEETSIENEEQKLKITEKELKQNESKKNEEKKVQKNVKVKNESTKEKNNQKSLKPKQNSSETKTSEEKSVSPKKETKAVENKELANTRYTKTNEEVVPKIMKILDDEIAKHEELKRYDTKAIKATKAQTSSTNAFTYMFVKDVEKGKVVGNYITFDQRVRNTVGAGGKYYVYAEDEYVYNSTGTKAYWSQTLVWIYITF